MEQWSTSEKRADKAKEQKSEKKADSAQGFLRRRIHNLNVVGTASHFPTCLNLPDGIVGFPSEALHAPVLHLKRSYPGPGEGLSPILPHLSNVFLSSLLASPTSHAFCLLPPTLVWTAGVPSSVKSQ